MIAIFGLVLMLGISQSANKKDGPLVSDKDPLYLSCTVWTGKNWTASSPRSAKTPVLASKAGFRAYGEVKVEVHGEDCENTTTLFVANGPDDAFRPMKVPTKTDGSGIRLVGWSPNGKLLLFELNQWAYETDTGFSREPVIFDVGSNSLSELPELDKSLTARFGSECEFEHSVVRWRTDSEFSIKISRTPLDEGYEQHFCVKAPAFLVYDLEKKTVSSLPRPGSAGQNTADKNSRE